MSLYSYECNKCNWPFCQVYLQNNAGAAMHHLVYKDGGAGPQTSVSFFLLVLLVFAVKIMALAIVATAMIRHFARYSELFSYSPEKQKC